MVCLAGCGAFDDGGNDLFVIDYQGELFAQAELCGFTFPIAYILSPG